MISQTIQSQIQGAMKAKDELRVSTLKMLSSALSYEKSNVLRDLSGEEELAVIRREVKKRNDAIALYEQGEAPEKAQKEKDEIVILKEFLPEEMGESELSQLVNLAVEETGAKEMKDMGKVISFVKEKSKGNADGAKIAEMVRKLLK